MRWQLRLAVSLGFVTILLLLGGCGECEVSKVEEQNMALVRHVHAELAKGNLTVFDEVLSPDYVRHCQAMPPELQELHGTEQFKAFIADFWGSVSDFRETIDVMFASGDKVAYVTTMYATQTGPMGDLPATGKSFEVVNIIIHRFVDGKIVETWVSWDNLAMLAQLGLFPPPPPTEKP